MIYYLTGTGVNEVDVGCAITARLVDNCFHPSCSGFDITKGYYFYLCGGAYDASIDIGVGNGYGDGDGDGARGSFFMTEGLGLELGLRSVLLFLRKENGNIVCAEDFYAGGFYAGVLETGVFFVYGIAGFT